MFRKKLLFVLDLAPIESHADGFAPRAYSLILAASQDHTVDILCLNKNGLKQCSEDLAKHVRTITFVDVGSNPLYARGMEGRRRRWRHHLQPTKLSAAYPATVPWLSEYVANQPPDLICFYLPQTCHLAFTLPEKQRCLFILEEGLERSFNVVGGETSRLKRFLVKVAEVRAARVLYARLSKRGGSVIAISELEASYFAKYLPRKLIKVVPLGVDCDYFKPREDVEPSVDVGMFGVMSHRRTYEPVMEFLQCLRDQKGADRITCLVVGKEPPPMLKALGSETVNVTGYVDDVRPYYAQVKIVLVPSIKGGGVKTTVLQPWAMCKAVVATPFALQGIPARNGANVIIAQGAEASIESVKRLLVDEELRRSIAIGGQKVARLERSKTESGKIFSSILSELVYGENR